MLAASARFSTKCLLCSLPSDPTHPKPSLLLACSPVTPHDRPTWSPWVINVHSCPSKKNWKLLSLSCLNPPSCLRPWPCCGPDPSHHFCLQDTPPYTHTPTHTHTHTHTHTLTLALHLLPARVSQLPFSPFLPLLVDWVWDWTLLCSFFSVSFLGSYLEHMEVPRLGVKSELQLLAYTTAIATWDLRHICNLCHSFQQHQILNPRSMARDRISPLMDTNGVRKPLSQGGNSIPALFFVPWTH